MLIYIKYLSAGVIILFTGYYSVPTGLCFKCNSDKRHIKIQSLWIALGKCRACPPVKWVIHTVVKYFGYLVKSLINHSMYMYLYTIYEILYVNTWPINILWLCIDIFTKLKDQMWSVVHYSHNRETHSLRSQNWSRQHFRKSNIYIAFSHESSTDSRKYTIFWYFFLTINIGFCFLRYRFLN